MLIHAEALEVDHPAGTKLRLNRARDVDWTLEAQLSQAVLDDRELDGDDARHLNGAAERDLSVALREVQVANAELGALDMDW